MYILRGGVYNYWFYVRIITFIYNYIHEYNIHTPSKTYITCISHTIYIYIYIYIYGAFYKNQYTNNWVCYVMIFLSWTQHKLHSNLINSFRWSHYIVFIILEYLLLRNKQGLDSAKTHSLVRTSDINFYYTQQKKTFQNFYTISIIFWYDATLIFFPKGTM